MNKLTVMLGDPSLQDAFKVEMELTDNARLEEFDEAIRTAGRVIWQKLHPMPRLTTTVEDFIAEVDAYERLWGYLPTFTDALHNH